MNGTMVYTTIIKMQLSDAAELINIGWLLCLISERRPTELLLKNTGLLSVNQLAASIKLSEVWKSINLVNYPIQLEPNVVGKPDTDRTLRTSSCRLWNQDAKTRAERESFSRNAAKIWNNAPLAIKNATTLTAAKKEIKRHCLTLPK